MPSHGQRPNRFGPRRVVAMKLDPFGLATVPADVVAGLRSLPDLSGQLEAIAKATVVLPAVLEAIEGVREFTQALPDIKDSIQSVARDTAGLPDVKQAISAVAVDTRALPELQGQVGDLANATAILPTMDERIARIEDAMPVLVEVQRHLDKLPTTMEELGAGISQLAVFNGPAPDLARSVRRQPRDAAVRGAAAGAARRPRPRRFAFLERGATTEGPGFEPGRRGPSTSSSPRSGTAQPSHG